jgi:S-formylglutathione hydrolase FrmB
MKTLFLLFLLVTTWVNAFCATVDTLDIPSAAMKRSFKCVVIRPVLEEGRQYPVVYLLHGFSGAYNNWIMKVPALKEYADEFNMIIVCPDGGYSSWYFDSPVDPAVKFETYIAEEVPAYIDTKYPTRKDRKGRAISGLSMGGHGGLFIGFRHADSFGACGSMSGGVDLSFSRNKFDVSKRIGDTIKYAENWKKYSVINVVEKKPLHPLEIIIDCGTDDFFYKNNRDLHEKMVKLKIPHEYIERPGNHGWPYWSNAVKYQLFFFHNYFGRN